MSYLDANETPDNVIPQRRFRFPLTRFGSIERNDDVPYLVKELIPTGGLTVVYGEPKCGKSFWMFDVSMHIALGRPYRGKKVQQGPVVYVALEGGRQFHNRVEAWRQYHRVADGDFYLMTERLDLIADYADLIMSIRQQTATKAPVVVVIDTLNRSLLGSENRDEDMAAYIKAADAMRHGLGCAVVVIHHCGHAENNRPRGHSSLRGAADCEIAVTRDSEAKTISTLVHWMKDGAEGFVTNSKLTVIDLGVDCDGDPINSCIVEPTEPVAAAPPGKPSNHELFMRIFEATLRTRGEDRKPSVNADGEGPTVRAIDLALVRDEYLKTHSADTEDGRAKAYRRAVHSAHEVKGTISIHQDDNGTQWAWRTAKNPVSDIGQPDTPIGVVRPSD